MGMQQIYKFEAKLSQGAAEQSISRDVSRMLNRYTHGHTTPLHRIDKEIHQEVQSRITPVSLSLSVDIGHSAHS